MEFSLPTISPPPLTPPPEAEIPPHQVWANLTVNQQKQLVQTILTICREIFVPLLRRENEVQHE